MKLAADVVVDREEVVAVLNRLEREAVDAVESSPFVLVPVAEGLVPDVTVDPEFPVWDVVDWELVAVVGDEDDDVTVVACALLYTAKTPIPEEAT